MCFGSLQLSSATWQTCKLSSKDVRFACHGLLSVVSSYAFAASWQLPITKKSDLENVWDGCEVLGA
jgi:hypothetical protein